MGEYTDAWQERHPVDESLPEPPNSTATKHEIKEWLLDNGLIDSFDEVSDLTKAELLALTDTE